jgi:hypothetical protein
MKGLVNRILGILLLSGLFATTALSQPSAQEIAANLRLQLSEIEVRQAELQARDEQLEEDLKPENIERSLAGIGSTRRRFCENNAGGNLRLQRPVVASSSMNWIVATHVWRRPLLKQTPQLTGRAPA